MFAVYLNGIVNYCVLTVYLNIPKAINQIKQSLKLRKQKKLLKFVKLKYKNPKLN